MNQTPTKILPALSVVALLAIALAASISSHPVQAQRPAPPECFSTDACQALKQEFKGLRKELRPLRREMKELRHQFLELPEGDPQRHELRQQARELKQDMRQIKKELRPRIREHMEACRGECAPD